MKMNLSQTCYRFFSTLSNPARLAMLENLSERSMSVSEIAEALRQEQSMISHNLSLLARCGFVHVERKGKERVYHLNKETFETLLRIVENHAQKYCPTRGLCRR